MNIDAEMKMLGGQLRKVLRGGLMEQPDVRAGIVTGRSADAEGNVTSYSVDVISHDGSRSESINIPAAGSSYGIGQAVQLERVGGSALGFYRLSERITPYGTETPLLVGGLNTFTPTLIEGLGFHIPRGDGCIVVGGTLVRPSTGTPYVTGTRVRICANGIKGLSDTGSGDRIAFMLATEDHTTYENNLPYPIGAGDAQLGYRAQGHLYVDSDAGTFSWNVGDTTLIQSQMIDDLPYTQVAGLLRLSDSFVGEGIELGKDYRDAYVLQMLNRYNVPLIVLRAGYADDPDRAYMRIGPPPPAPGITATSVNGTPVLVVDGEIIRNTSLTASKFNITRISDINGDLGVIQAGRAEFLRPGTSFLNWANFGTADGVVIGFDDQTQRGRLLGLEGGVINTEVDSLGQIRWASGRGTLNLDGLDYTYNATNYVRVSDNPGVAGEWLEIKADPSTGGPDDGIYVLNIGTGTDNSALYGYATGGPGLHAFSQNWYGAYIHAGTYPALYLLSGAASAGIFERGGSNTNTAGEILNLLSNTSGTPAAGYGSRILWQLKSSTTEDQNAAAMDTIWTTATHASRTAALVWYLVNNGAALAEYMRLSPSALQVKPLLCTTPGSVLTIATGAITVTSSFHFVDTESSAASDDLDTINGGVDGAILVLRANSSARDVVCRDGTGNLSLAGDFTMNNVADTITLLYYNGTWNELSRSDNAA